MQGGYYNVTAIQLTAHIKNTSAASSGQSLSYRAALGYETPAGFNSVADVPFDPMPGSSDVLFQLAPGQSGDAVANLGLNRVYKVLPSLWRYQVYVQDNNNVGRSVPFSAIWRGPLSAPE